MRLFVASLATETNTFSPVFTDLRDFRDNFYFPPGQHPDLPSLCSAPFIALREYRDRMGGAVEAIEGSAAWAEPGGIVSCAAYAQLRDEILGQLRDAMPLDGVLLGLHGAMVAQGVEDCEGDLLSEVRGIVGRETVVGATFDPHSHFTRRCADALDVAITFKEFPHTDVMERARELVEIVARAVRREVKPRISLFDCRMIDVFPTTEASFRAFVDRLSALERDLPHVLSISIVHGFLAGDVPEMGDESRRRHRRRPAGRPRPGAPTRTGAVLDAGHDEDGAAGAVRSSRPARRPVRQRPAGDRGRVGQSGRGHGGRLDRDPARDRRPLHPRRRGRRHLGSHRRAVLFRRRHGRAHPASLRRQVRSRAREPVDANVTVAGLSENGFMRFGGTIARLGRCAAIRLDEDIEVVLCENRVQAYTPDIFSCVGIDPSSKSLLVVKSTNHFRAAFSELTDRVLYVDSGAPYPHDPRTTPYEKLERGIWPIVASPAHDL